MDRLIETTDPGSNVKSYSYDPRGNLTSAADSDSAVTLAYDNRNRLVTTMTDGTVGPQPAVTLTYAYDTEGNGLFQHRLPNARSSMGPLTVTVSSLRRRRATIQ